MIPVQQIFSRLQRVFTRDIWRSDVLAEKTARGYFYATLRVVSMTWTGVVENSLASRAAALSYSSILGLAPLVLLAVVVSGVILQRTNTNDAVDQIYRGLATIAPQIAILQEQADKAEKSSDSSATDTGSGAPSVSDTTSANAAKAAPGAQQIRSAPKSVISNFLVKFIEGSSSKAIGVTGAIGLIFIVIQLFSSIENAFNGIWGVRRGRNWILRIVFYWTVVTLGAVITFSAIAMQSASSLESMNMGSQVQTLLRVLAPMISWVTLIGVLTLFYKYIPNTTVGWWPSLIGGTIVVLLINLNNFLAFLYIKNVAINRSLYGNLAVPLVLTLGLYIFWLILLVGGQITYAIQNANYRSSQLAWSDLNHVARRGIGLLVFALICRRFRECRTPYTATQLAEIVRIPTQILNACLQRLKTLDLVSPVSVDEAKASQEHRFQPARPLDSVTVSDFKRLFEEFGEGPSRELLDSLDPIVRHFHRRLDEATAKAFVDDTLDSLIERLPLDALPAVGEGENASPAAITAASTSRGA